MHPFFGAVRVFQCVIRSAQSGGRVPLVQLDFGGIHELLGTGHSRVDFNLISGFVHASPDSFAHVAESFAAGRAS